MTDVIVIERRFDEPASFQDLQERETAARWCLEQHTVLFAGTYVALDLRTMVCLYRAPDVEAVRTSQRVAGLPVARAWAAIPLGGELRAATPPRTTWIVERTFAEPVTASLARETMTRGSCMQLHDVDVLASHLARDGRRMLCVISAPDAEAVRTSSRKLQLPIDRLWAATFHVE
jgi:hypothetical protein